MSSKPQDGELFSRAYLQPTTRLHDSPRFRARLGNYLQQHFRDFARDFAELVERELGNRISFNGLYWDIREFFRVADLRDVLDSITLALRFLESRHYDTIAFHWGTFAARVFQEEGMGYQFDSRGGVRYVVDEEFERNRQSIIAGLGEPRYANVAHLIETAYAKFDAAPFDTKGCVREIFEAAETLTKLITGSNQALDEGFVKKTLIPLAQSVYQRNDPAAATAAIHLIEGFGHWVNAGHKYRHGHKSEEPVAPPDEIAILFVSQGAAYIRWLIDLDRMKTERDGGQASPK